MMHDATKVGESFKYKKERTVFFEERIRKKVREAVRGEVFCFGDKSRGFFSVLGAGTWLFYFDFLLCHLKLFLLISRFIRV